MSTTESGTLLSARDLVKVYGSGPTAVDAVRGVSLDLRAGELVLVMGPSGSGKTLLSMLGGLLRPTSGAIEIGGTDTTALDERSLARMRARQIGFVFQAFNLLASLTAKENIMFPARLAAVGHRAARARAEALLERLGLTERRHALPRSLSGGEKQRVAIARALINEASIILADEPTGNLDSERGQEVVMILHDLARDEGRSVLIVTHDPRVEDVADRILWLEDGSLRDRKRERRAWARDPVCGMRVDAMSAAFSAERGAGERAVFCSRRCLERFNEDPARFVSVADGAVLPPGTPLRSGG
jgi:putative ABC transport system ATP-binding protein